MNDPTMHYLVVWFDQEQMHLRAEPCVSEDEAHEEALRLSLQGQEAWVHERISYRKPEEVLA